MLFVLRCHQCLNMFFAYEFIIDQIHMLVQEKCNSSVLAMELHISCINPSEYSETLINAKSEPTGRLTISIYFL